jgi:hypothetical protein
MKIAYNNKEAKKFYQKVISIRKETKHKHYWLRDTEIKMASNKEKVMKRWSEYY